MSSLLDPLLMVLPPLLTEKNSEDLTDALTSLISVATEHPKMFRASFASLVQFTISVVAEKELEDDARQAALELLVTFAEGAPVMCRKDEHYTMATVEQTLSLMCDHDDDAAALAEWQNTDDVHHIPSELISSWISTSRMQIGLLENKQSIALPGNLARRLSFPQLSHTYPVLSHRQIGVNDMQA
jgi:hypothetical protein